ncbi:MAG: hypothetical protein CVV34_06160, partial [Methanomicrobiales archaeon HGW-Methanomicrobiales-5]
MKIHTRTLLILGATVFILIFAMNFLAQFVVLSSYAQLEERESLVNLNRVTDQIEFEKENLGEKARDWAIWDDTFSYMADRNPVYAQSNIDLPASFESLQIQGILYYTGTGDYFDGRYYNLQTKTQEEVPKNLREYFVTHADLLTNSSPDTTTGFIVLPEGP